jgi:D-alanine-D-alanine ligase
MTGKLRVAVIYGGRSGEHEISVRSSQAIIQALESRGHEVVRYFIDKQGKWDPQPILPEPGSNGEIDVAFPILHGTFGEDGTMQGLLELADLPYVAPGVLGSAVAMDKEVSKRLLKQSGIPVVDYLVVRRGEIDPFAIIEKLGLPVFVKPANLGSSVGISKVKRPEELEPALREAMQFDRKVIVEKAVQARELECAVMGNDEPIASAPCEIFPSREFYDYDDKYLLDKARIDNPADLPSETVAAIQKIAVDAFIALECEGMSRVDFLLDKQTGVPYVNEVNTIPGFTNISMFPKMWEAAGVTFVQLIDSLLRLAVQRHAAKADLRYEK